MPEGAAERADPGGKHWPSTAIGADFASLGRRVPVQWRADGQAGDGRSGDGELRLRLSRVGWHSVAAAEDAALPERWPTGRRRARRSRVGQGQGGQALAPKGEPWAVPRWSIQGGADTGRCSRAPEPARRASSCPRNGGSTYLNRLVLPTSSSAPARVAACRENPASSMHKGSQDGQSYAIARRARCACATYEPPKRLT
jgi:hypothetical protein